MSGGLSSSGGSSRDQQIKDAQNKLGHVAPRPPDNGPDALTKSAKAQQALSSVSDAARRAAQTGVPQPVSDKSGLLLYYVDADGAVVPDAIAQDAYSRRGLAFQPSAQGAAHDGTLGPAQRDQAAYLAAHTPPPTPGQNAATQNDYNRLAQRPGGYYNGQFVPPDGALPGDYAVGNPTAIKPGKNPGMVSVTDHNGNTVERVPMTPAEQHVVSEQMAAATYSALNVPSNAANRTFILSQGPGGLAPTGIDVATLGSRQDNRQDLQLGPRGEYANQPINSPQVQNAAQTMSLQDSVQWFAKLAASDPSTYNALVGLLNQAGYFSSSGTGNYLPTSALPLNGFTFPAGEAWVRAGLDLSAANAGGDNRDMMTWLKSRSQGYQDYLNSGAGFVAQSRAYQDPATLAASAKSAAQAALGRNLTPAEEAAFEAHFRSLENQGYDSRDSADQARTVAQFTGQTGGVGGGSYTLPDTTGQADQFVNDNPQFAQEKAGYSALELTKGLVNFLMGNGNL